MSGRRSTAPTTATADARVVADVSATLALRRDAFSWTASFNRPRLRYEVRPKTSKPKAIEQIAAHVRAHADESGLVYCLSRRDCEVVCEAPVSYTHLTLPTKRIV